MSGLMESLINHFAEACEKQGLTVELVRDASADNIRVSGLSKNPKRPIAQGLTYGLHDFNGDSILYGLPTAFSTPLAVMDVSSKPIQADGYDDFGRPRRMKLDELRIRYVSL